MTCKFQEGQRKPRARLMICPHESHISHHFSLTSFHMTDGWRTKREKPFPLTKKYLSIHHMGRHLDGSVPRTSERHQIGKR